MKIHFVLACILGSLTVCFAILADFAEQPDSVDSIAYIQRENIYKVSRRFLRSSGSIRRTLTTEQAPRKRGVMSLV